MADSPLEDQELLGQLRQGNETAFTVLYERYQGAIYRFVLHMSGNAATAEEVTQEVFTLLIGNPKGYQADKGNLGNYLFGVARNLTRRLLQRSRLDLPIEEDWLDTGDAGFTSDLDVLSELILPQHLPTGQMLTTLQSKIEPRQAGLPFRSDVSAGHVAVLRTTQPLFAPFDVPAVDAYELKNAVGAVFDIVGVFLMRILPFDECDLPK